MENIEFYNYLKMLYNFDIDSYYKKDFMSKDFDMVQSFKEFQDVGKIVNFGINKYTINNLFVIQLECLDPIFWKSVLNVLNSGCDNVDFSRYKDSLLKIFRIFARIENNNYGNYEYFINLVYKMIKLYILLEFRIDNVFKCKDDIEALIIKDKDVYYVDFNVLYKIENKRLMSILRFKEKKDWSKIYDYLDIQNCYCMCDNIRT